MNANHQSEASLSDDGPRPPDATSSISGSDGDRYRKQLQNELPDQSPQILNALSKILNKMDKYEEIPSDIQQLWNLFQGKHHLFLGLNKFLSGAFKIEFPPNAGEDGCPLVRKDHEVSLNQSGQPGLSPPRFHEKPLGDRRKRTLKQNDGQELKRTKRLTANKTEDSSLPSKKNTSTTLVDGKVGNSFFGSVINLFMPKPSAPKLEEDEVEHRKTRKEESNEIAELKACVAAREKEIVELQKRLTEAQQACVSNSQASECQKVIVPDSVVGTNEKGAQLNDEPTLQPLEVQNTKPSRPCIISAKNKSTTRSASEPGEKNDEDQARGATDKNVDRSETIVRSSIITAAGGGGSENKRKVRDEDDQGNQRKKQAAVHPTITPTNSNLTEERKGRGDAKTHSNKEELQYKPLPKPPDQLRKLLKAEQHNEKRREAAVDLMNSTAESLSHAVNTSQGARRQEAKRRLKMLAMFQEYIGFLEGKTADLLTLVASQQRQLSQRKQGHVTSTGEEERPLAIEDANAYAKFAIRKSDSWVPFKFVVESEEEIPDQVRYTLLELEEVEDNANLPDIDQDGADEAMMLIYHQTHKIARANREAMGIYRSRAKRFVDWVHELDYYIHVDKDDRADLGLKTSEWRDPILVKYQLISEFCVRLLGLNTGSEDRPFVCSLEDLQDPQNYPDYGYGFLNKVRDDSPYEVQVFDSFLHLFGFIASIPTRYTSNYLLKHPQGMFDMAQCIESDMKKVKKREVEATSKYKENYKDPEMTVFGLEHGIALLKLKDTTKPKDPNTNSNEGKIPILLGEQCSLKRDLPMIVLEVFYALLREGFFPKCKNTGVKDRLSDLEVQVYVRAEVVLKEYLERHCSKDDEEEDDLDVKDLFTADVPVYRYPHLYSSNCTTLAFSGKSLPKAIENKLVRHDSTVRVKTKKQEQDRKKTKKKKKKKNQILV